MSLTRSKPMSRGTGLRPISAKREQELQEAGVHPVSTLRSHTPAKRAKAKPLDNPDPHTVDAVLERDNYSSVVDGQGISGVRGVDWVIHHRLRRSQGGDHSPANLVVLAAEHHNLIHSRVRWAQEHGWLVKSGQDPATVPMDHAAYPGRVLLTPDGRAGIIPEALDEH